MPNKLDHEEFYIDFCDYDINGRIGNIVRTGVTLIRIVGGALQIMLDVEQCI